MNMSLLVEHSVPWFDGQCRRVFDIKQEAHLHCTRERSRANWEEFFCCQIRANETYSEAKRLFSVRNRDVLMSAQSLHKWWSTLKLAVFGVRSTLPPLLGGGGRLECESVRKADLLSDHFEFQATHKVCRSAIHLPSVS